MQAHVCIKRCVHSLARRSEALQKECDLIPNAQSFQADKELAAQRYPCEDSDGMLMPRGRGEKDYIIPFVQR